MEGFAGHAEQANVRVRRYAHRNVGYAEAVQPLQAAAGS
jgi:sulfopropanediol 3-dehydrogenase